MPTVSTQINEQYDFYTFMKMDTGTAFFGLSQKVSLTTVKSQSEKERGGEKVDRKYTKN